MNVRMEEEKENREETLGFKPQKEVFYNSLLPYSDKLDEESSRQFAEIKGELCRAVALRDLKVGTTHWVTQLNRYIRIYGRKFSKEDHILLVKLAYELVVIPDLEVSLVVKFGVLLGVLLKKKELLSRDDLVLPWRPLYNQAESILYSRYEQHGLQLLPSNIEGSLKNLVRVCRPYFPLESTQEMLDEWRPLLCPFDVTVIKGLSYLENFLPTNLPPEHHGKGFKLWFDELINLWDSFQNTPSFENMLVAIFSRLANDNIGYIDWTPYIPKIFTRILRSYNLPVGTQAVQIGRSDNCYDIGRTTTWMAALLGGNSCAQDAIDKLFAGLQSFFHPSNLGRWNMKLNQVLLKLPQAVVRRVHRERYKKPSWEQTIPDSHKLTDDDITRFVLCMRPVALIAIFGKFGCHEAGLALKYLATLRPELIVPPLLERTYPAMETLTEPHRLISCMTSLVGVAGPMLRAGKWYREGPSHVLPLLHLSLPGIDPNDFKKCLVTFQMISTFVSLVPLVDCSEANLVRTDLTEEERDLCSATAQFEDFVLQYMDKIFSLIENNTQDHGHTNTTESLNPEQRLLELGLTSTFTSVLQQSSTALFKSALRRLHKFITETVLEAKVGGRFVANLCRAAARVNPEIALKQFLPLLCSNIKDLMTAHGNITKDEHLDDGLMWNIVLLSEVVRCDGSVLLQYLDELTEVLQLTLHLSCKQAYELSASTLKSILRALTLVYPLDFRSVSVDIDAPVKDYLAIRDWGKPGDLKDLRMKWHIPSDIEITAAEQLTRRFLVPELESIKSVTTDNNVSRDELLQRLTIVGEVLMGTGSLLPALQGKPLPLIESMVALSKLTFASKTTDRVITLDGKNVREAVIEAIRPLLSFMLASCEDDTKGLFKLLAIYNAVLFFHGAKKDDFDGRWKSFQVVKKGLEDKLHGSKCHIRALLVDRVQLQNEMRLLSATDKTVTDANKVLFDDLLTLALSRYSEVRKKAQASLSMGFHEFAYSYRCVLPDILAGLKNSSDIPEYRFKGSLYLLLGNGKQCMATKRSWETLGQIWPAMVTSQHSEKPSILKLIDDIMNKICKCYETVAVATKVNEASLSAALALGQSGTPKPFAALPSETEIKSALTSEETRNSTALRLYLKLIDDLVDLVEGGKLRWKFSEIAMELLAMLLRYDVPPPVRLIQLFVIRMVDDSLRVRKLSLGAVSAIQKQLKRPHNKLKVDPYKISGTQPLNGSIKPGGRADNLWHLYPKDDKPLSKEAWDSATFVDKTHWGFYQWPSQLTVYAPYEEQPKVGRTSEELSDRELVIYKSFSDQDFVDRLLSFMALEENKGKDKFEGKHVTLFKGIFRNFGDMFLAQFKPGLERLVTDMSHDKHESSQRCAMEVLAGILRGSKHWPYEKLVSLWAWAGGILKKAVVNITVETREDWGAFFSVICESRDPRKLTWMFRLVMDSLLSGDGGSFGDASRLFVVQHAIVQQEWRIPELLQRLFFSLSPHLAHPYKNVRDRIGCLLANIFLYDYVIPGGAPTTNPKRKELLQHVLPQLECLKTLSPTNSAAETPSPVSPEEQSSELKEVSMEIENHKENDERKIAIRLCKTVLKWLANSLGRTFTTCTEEMFALLPVICAVEKETADDELVSSCTVVMAYLSQAFVQPELLPVALATIQQVSEMPSWHARSSILAYLQVMVFCNFFTLNKPEFVHQIKTIVLKLLCDEQLEVRQMAAVTLSGLFHCGYLHMDKELLDHFEQLSRTKLKKRQRNVPLGPSPTEALIKRHAGVLGFSACVQAYPYDVPKFMPQILMDLSNHVNDPQPIQLTVKKTLSNFRRTHHDNWHDHKQKFTDDQLVILTDLLVSPNYYA